MQPLNDYNAVAIAEGWMEPPGDTVDEQRAAVLAAWQYLHDTGLGYRLQGWFGRTLHALRAQGYVSEGDA